MSALTYLRLCYAVLSLLPDPRDQTCQIWRSPGVRGGPRGEVRLLRKSWGCEGRGADLGGWDGRQRDVGYNPRRRLGTI